MTAFRRRREPAKTLASNDNPEFETEFDTDWDTDVTPDDAAPVPRAGRRPGPRRGVKRSVMQAIRQIPSYLRLLVGLVGDRRVSAVDRLLVVGALAYIVSPLDFIPDIIPFLGQVDDVFLLFVAMQRLVDNAGLEVLRDHWKGRPADLEDLDLARVISAAGFFLPAGLRRRIRRMMGRR
jgi:uncharacterized membrane protein YkvA (DUF1232 family)